MNILDYLYGKVSDYAKDVKEGYNYLASSPTPVQDYAQAAKEKTSKALLNYLNGIQESTNQMLTGNPIDAVMNHPIAQLLGGGIMAEVGPLYHGSPYKFTNFANEKIGTGEGAQSFGYGHYLTENPTIAKHYAEKVGFDTGKIYDRLTNAGMSDYGAELLTTWAYEGGYSQGQNASKFLRGFLDKDFKMDNPELYNEISLALKDKKKMDAFKGILDDQNVYTTTVNKGLPSSEDVFLEWDKPLIDQPHFLNTIQDAMKKRGFEDWQIKSMMERKATGGQFYNALHGMESGPLASKLLSDAGITGIKYPSGTLSGIKDSPYYNYVIFDPKRITIDKINDEPIRNYLMGGQ